MRTGKWGRTGMLHQTRLGTGERRRHYVISRSGAFPDKMRSLRNALKVLKCTWKNPRLRGIQIAFLQRKPFYLIIVPMSKEIPFKLFQFKSVRRQCAQLYDAAPKPIILCS